MGENGAGKTTLVKLLLRLYDPEAGEILLDGRPYRAYQLDSLRAQFAVAFQDSRLYPFSVSENVRAGRVESEEAVREALNRAGLAGLAPSRAVTREFDADGWTPSGGQAQRLFAAPCSIRWRKKRCLRSSGKAAAGALPSSFPTG